jgi:5-methylcytosine-specific restriction endonuclease McrA
VSRVSLQVGELIERDGRACVWCGRELWDRDLTREHVVPRSRGGHMTLENAVVACRACNRRRGSRPVDAFVRELLREGAAVDVTALREALGRLARSGRRTHREAALAQLRRLESL